jgi:hypothetical protein
MASIIKIKRSGTSGAPSSLKQGELAYSYLAGTQANGGDRLYVGTGALDGNGNATSLDVVGGKYFTDQLDHVKGALTASSAIVVDANSKIDNIRVDNIDIDGNTISSTNANGNIVIDPNGIGTVDVSGARVTNAGAPSAGTDLATKDYVDNNVGATQLTIGGNTGTDTINTQDSDLTFTGTDGIVTAVTDNTVTYSISDGGITSAKLANSGVTLGSYGSTTAVPIITVNAKGQITNVTTASISGEMSITGDTGSDTISLRDSGLDFAGGTGLTTAVTNNVVTITLDNTTVTPASYGDATNIPTFTVDQQGRLTAAGTVAVAGTLTTAGTSGTGDVSLLDSSLTVDGADGVTTTASGSSITVGLTDGGIASAKLANTTVVSGSYGSTGAIPTFTVNAKGQITAAGTVSVSSTLNTAGDAGTGDISLLDSSLSIVGGSGITTTASGASITVAGLDASTTVKGVASFGADNFSVSAGVVTIKDGGVNADELAGTLDLSGKTVTLAAGEISNGELANSTIEINGTSISLGGNATLDTDDINEGSNNLYYTSARADSDARYSLTVTDNGGDGSLTYTASTGEIVYTGPSASETRAHFSAGTGVDITDGVISIGQVIDSSADVTVNTLTTVGNVTIGGNLQVNGSQTIVSSQSLSVTDNMIYMNAGESDNSPAADIDIGFAGNYNDIGSYAHAGFFRDASDGVWKIFQGYTPEPDADVQIDVGHASFSLADLAVKDLSASTFTGKYLGFDSDFGDKTTDNLTEGSNLYYTTARVDSDMGDILTAGTGISITPGAGIITIAGTNAAADGSTKGIAAFDATHFAAASGVISANDITLSGDAGSAAATLGETFTIAGTSAQGISTSGTGTSITITAANATTSAKGVAQFTSSMFDVASGVVSSKDITFNAGTGSLAQTLGESLTITGSGAISTSATGSTLTVAVANATVSSKGVAQFDSDNFDVISGVVSIDTVDGGSY